MPSRRSSISTPSTWTKAWFQSRYDKVGPGGTGKDYINCPMDEAISTTPSSTR
jgi:folate-dependent tRNA-U54 methylase TrmFO/GidA